MDWYAQLRSERAAERADVALVVCDASEGVTSEDLRVAELAMKKGCATVLVLNKWDIEDVDLEFTRARVEQKLRLRPKVMTASAKTGRGVKRLLDEALDAGRARERADPDARAEPLPGRPPGHARPAGGARQAAAASTTWPSTTCARRGSRSR